jgi:glycosyltransferase involved in cell wall biosynthesis
MTKIAFVTPWYGADIPGGMESETRRTAAHLHQAGFNVEILTTTIRDFFADWGRNHHKAGVSESNGITVRRFRVQSRDKVAFDEINRRLMHRQSISAEEEQTYINEMFASPDLIAYIGEHCQEYFFFFIPYMFASTYHGLQVCPRRSALIPCFHDESYAYLSIYRDVFPQAHTMILQTSSERDLADRIYGAASEQWRPVVGTGVDSDFSFDAARFRQKYGVDNPFLLYVGRRDAGKNVPLLLHYWERYIQSNPETAVRLVLLGPGEIAIPAAAQPYTYDFGFVPLQDKYDAYAAGDVFCQPSINESFSLVIMEAWLTETPVLVNGRCAVTREHVRRSNGGLYFNNYAEFAATLAYLLTHSAQAKRMGENGRDYVLSNYQWPTIVAKYAQIIKRMAADAERPTPVA